MRREILSRRMEFFNCNVQKKPILDTSRVQILHKLTYPAFYHITFYSPFAKSTSNDANIGFPKFFYHSDISETKPRFCQLIQILLEMFLCFIYLFIYMYIYISVNIYTYLYLYLSNIYIHIYIYLFIYLFMYLFIYLCNVYVSIYLFFIFIKNLKCDRRTLRLTLMDY